MKFIDYVLIQCFYGVSLCWSRLPVSKIYIVFKKLASLIVALLCARRDLVKSLAVLIASATLSCVPSPTGISIVCSLIGIASRLASRSVIPALFAALFAAFFLSFFVSATSPLASSPPKLSIVTYSLPQRQLPLPL